MQFERSSGILMPVFSLPSPHGIGTLGKSAFAFIDFLKEAGQSYWQMLPLTPSGCGDSPYSSYSVFAGNPYLIDLDDLVSMELLTEEEIGEIDWENDPDHIDYSIFHEHHEKVLRKAFARKNEALLEKMHSFCMSYGAWVENYALYMALKKHFGGGSWMDWDDAGIRKHEADAVAKYKEMLAEDVTFFVFEQYLFYKQWEEVRAYAKEKEISLIGDIPIYVACDSADVWAEPHFFQLDEENIPTFVAGVPPDYFSEDGQLWGNPLYDWEAMERDGYGWWIRRIDHASKLFDVLRIDHFRGLASYWAVPYGAESAKEGHWVKGPGEKFVNVLTSWFSGTKFIAEDLGMLTPDVYDLLHSTGLPGMKVLEFAFDPVTPSSYLPHYYEKNCVCYTGTHDNATVAGWYKDGNPAEILQAKKYTGLAEVTEIPGTADGAEGAKAETDRAEAAEAEAGPAAADEAQAVKAETAPAATDGAEVERFTKAVLRAGMSSVAALFIAQIQDYFFLDNHARINVPGVAEGNWTWKMRPGMLTKEKAAEIAAMTKLYGR